MSKNQHVSLHQLSILCEEMAALVRAGVPLPEGLSLVAEELPGRLGKVSSKLASELDRGLDLPTAIRSCDENFPDYFPAMVEAGIRSGRLSVALEGIAATGKRMYQMRRDVILAFTPTIITLLIAYILFFALITFVVGRIGIYYESMRFQQNILTQWTSYLAAMPWYVVVLIPILLLLIIVVWIRKSLRSVPNQRQSWTTAWLRPARQLLARSQHSILCETLALLLEHEVPAGEAIRVATAASGDVRLLKAGNRTAEALEQGQSSIDSTGLPPLLQWFISSSTSAPDRSPELLSAGLRRIALSYRDEAQRQMDFLRIFLPAALTIGVGGATVLFYALVALWPWFSLLNRMGSMPEATF